MCSLKHAPDSLNSKRPKVYTWEGHGPPLSSTFLHPRQALSVMELLPSLSEVVRVVPSNAVESTLKMKVHP